MIEPIVPPADHDQQRDIAMRVLADIVPLLAGARRAGLVEVIEALEAAKAEAERLLLSSAGPRMDC